MNCFILEDVHTRGSHAGADASRSGRPDVHADSIAVGGIPLIQQPTGMMDEGEEGGLLSPGRLEERGHVPEGDDGGVAGATEGAGGE
ncbi:hypothetical protein J2T58_001358 [Methanocalculus alkaliphilus]|uniref:hypothetical protein n=1 Tax=Methanocalculus alkaliphilus TaxID=768730 RepID=UPI00209DB09C|nr:hypothetical protein [Methanocalculus alkaliphilus]MCP1715493.1 hypothetical protein [Methanocalculus alkaliphilus]